MKNFQITLFILIVTSQFLFSQNTIHVSENATEMNTGLSWNDAFVDLQDFDRMDMTSNTIEREIVIFEVYPNPSSTFLKLSKEHIADSFCIFDSKGRRITCNGLEKEIEVEFLESGMYILSLFRKGNFVGRTRFIKQ